MVDVFANSVYMFACLMSTPPPEVGTEHTSPEHASFVLLSCDVQIVLDVSFMSTSPPELCISNVFIILFFKLVFV